MPLFLLFLLVPIIEIALFIQVGGWIGLWPTLLIVVLTAFAGTHLLRQQGRQVMEQVRGSFADLRDPSEPLAHGAMVVFAGALLLTPGFFTDIVGLSLMIPAVRERAYRFLREKVERSPNVHFHVHQPGGQNSQTIDGEYEVVPPKDRNGPSKWTE